MGGKGYLRRVALDVMRRLRITKKDMVITGNVIFIRRLWLLRGEQIELLCARTMTPSTLGRITALGEMSPLSPWIMEGRACMNHMTSVHASLAQKDESGKSMLVTLTAIVLAAEIANIILETPGIRASGH